MDIQEVLGLCERNVVEVTPLGSTEEQAESGAKDMRAHIECVKLTFLRLGICSHYYYV